MLQKHTTEVPPPQVLALASHRGLMLRGPGGVIILSNKTLAAVAEFAIALQDLLHGDPDLEHDPLNEGEPALSASDRALCNEFGGEEVGCSISDPPEEDDSRRQ